MSATATAMDIIGEDMRAAGFAPASLEAADMALLRVGPVAACMPDVRATVARVIEADKADLVSLAEELAEAIDGNSEVNLRTGHLQCFVEPDFFLRLRRAVGRHSGKDALTFLRFVPSPSEMPRGTGGAPGDYGGEHPPAVLLEQAAGALRC
jgi:hypothetical protein